MDSKISDGGPAFPVTVNQVPLNGEHSEIELEHSGMSLRDWFAGMALQGLLVNTPDGNNGVEVCLTAYKTADAMIAIRHKKV